ncbi:MAG: UDP-N-acetylmuramate dehydrogenase [Chitinispirillaceae bacterium]|nr:UDP-N-acetylmuramate dehydrogenase [Chitinispirillaceae bacterium]
MLEIRASVALRDKTTFRIGGIAAWYAAPESASEHVEALGFAQERSLPVLVIGNGSNLLISDRGWPGLAIAVSDSGTAVEWRDNEAIVRAGCPLDALVRESIERGYEGLEELSGIPGTIGGAVLMNAGAFSICIADTVVSAEYIDQNDRRTVTASLGDLRLGYRTSALRNRQVIILSARFRFRKGNAVDLRARRGEILALRRNKQPLDLPNCGSVFKRPPGTFAGTLIEQAGLKGYRCGKVSISEKHANFIVNHGGGTAAEVRHLIVMAQKRVYERSGILLEPEVIFAGTFDEPLFTPA